MNGFPVVGLVDGVGHERCQWVLCITEAEYRVSLPSKDALLVCSLHVTPVVTSAWSDEDDFPVIKRIAS